LPSDLHMISMAIMSVNSPFICSFEVADTQTDPPLLVSAVVSLDNRSTFSRCSLLHEQPYSRSSRAPYPMHKALTV
jgi:hypothetical protein